MSRQEEFHLGVISHAHIASDAIDTGMVNLHRHMAKQAGEKGEKTLQTAHRFASYRAVPSHHFAITTERFKGKIPGNESKFESN